MLKLYGKTGSGNCYKPALLMRQLGVPFDWIEVDIQRGASRTPEFLARNPNGRVPLLEITDHGETRALAESNAMLCYLADGTHLLPDDRWPRAQVKGYAALGVMEQQLAKTSFLAGEHYTVADIALYAYTHVAHEGGYSLLHYPAVRRWLARVESQPHYAPMERAVA